MIPTVHVERNSSCRFDPLPHHLSGAAGLSFTARIERALPLSHFVRVSEVIPTAAVERPLLHSN